MERIVTSWRNLRSEIEVVIENIITNRPPPVPEEGGIGTRSVLYSVAASSITLYALRRVMIPQILQQIPATRLMTPKKQEEFASYVISTLHASMLSFWGAYMLKDKITLRPEGFSSRRVVAFSLGYFFEDLWASRHEWRTKPEFAVHHILAIASQSSTMWHIPTLRFGVLWGTTEWSTIFLNAMWFSRELAGESSGYFRFSAIAFAVSYFLCRILWMPGTWIAINVHYPKVISDFGVIPRSAISLVMLMQVWWFVAIVKNLKKKLLTSTVTL